MAELCRRNTTPDDNTISQENTQDTNYDDGCGKLALVEAAREVVYPFANGVDCDIGTLSTRCQFNTLWR